MIMSSSLLLVTKDWSPSVNQIIVQELITYPGTPLPPLVFKNALLGREEKKKNTLLKPLGSLEFLNTSRLFLLSPLSATNRQLIECLPSTSTRIKSCAATSVDFQHPLKGVRGREQKLLQVRALTPCWISFSDFNLYFFVFVIIIIHSGLPKRTPPLCWTIKLKCLYSTHRNTSWFCPPVNGCKKEGINTSLPQYWPFPEMICKTHGPFHLTSSSHLSLVL